MAFDTLKRKLDPALAVSVKFLLIGILWILFSDTLVGSIGSEGLIARMSHVQMVKGIFFVGVTAAAFFIILHQYTHDIKALKREQDYFYQNSPVPMALVDSFSFRFREANDATLKLLGYSMDELRAISVQQLIYAEDQSRFESVLLFIKTGFDGLGSWKFRCRDGSPLHANIYSKAIREKQMFLISFQDIRGQIKAEEEIRQLNQKLMFEVGKHTRQLEYKNEELAYRASQTQHINEELILVNEQLLNVNKKVAAERDQALNCSRIAEQLAHVVCSFDLGAPGRCTVSPQAAEFFETTIALISKPWFWLDFVHHDDTDIAGESRRKLSEKKESLNIYRINTASGQMRVVFEHLRLVTESDSDNLLVSFIDITDFSGSFKSAFRELSA